MQIRVKKVLFNNGVLLLSLIGYYFLFSKFNIGLPCLFHKFTGLYCPGCGITRCLYYLLHFDIKQAFHYNQFVVIFLPLFVFYYIYYLYTYIMDKENKLSNYKIIYIVILIILIIFGIWRNVSGYVL